MQLTHSLSMRPEMRQVLTPRMIQSMEILQLPLAALEERIEQELQSNPVLEMREGGDGEGDGPDGAPTGAGTDAGVDNDLAMRRDVDAGEKALVVKEGSDHAEDFERLDRIAEYLESEDFFSNGNNYTRAASSFDGERDRKLDAMNNTAARGGTLQEHLLGQWAFIEPPPRPGEQVPGDRLRRAGEAIINNIDADGYLRADMEQVQKDSVTRDNKTPVPMEDLIDALKLVQTLEPAGVGARNLRECLLLQLDALEGDEEAAEGHDFETERALVTDHLKDLEMNRYPQISRRLGLEIDEIKEAVRHLARLHPHPGRMVGGNDAPPITPDAIIYWDDDTGRYEIEMAHDPAPNLRISGMYRKMLKDRATCDKKTREFLSNNVRNARWLIESIEQRKSTIHRVIRAVVDAQKEFFDQGAEHLKPLPMILVADQLGIHVATVSRAVHDKWIQSPRGLFPLRKFFSGGTTSAEGEEMSWDAVKEKLKAIIDAEDPHNPLNDDEIVVKLKDQGIDLARRTVAKYRKLLNIPTARQRKEY